MRMPFIDLKTPYLYWQQDIRACIDKVLEHGQYVMGPEVEELEQSLSERVGVGHAIACSSGTDALLMALMALGIGPGDAVFTTPFSFTATAEVIQLAGATPVFVDIDPSTYNLDPEALDTAVRALAFGNGSHPLPGPALEQAGLTPRAVIAVNIFGQPADYDRIQQVADTHGLAVVEDAAQSFGAQYKGRPSCGLGRIACTSFFPAKPLGCYGDGGAVFTDEDDLADILRSIRNHGSGRDKYDTVRLGLNGRLDTIQAAILLVKLMGFPAEMSNRQHLAGLYSRLLAESCPELVVPAVAEGSLSAWAQYSVQAENREAIRKGLQDAGIPTAIYYARPLHLQPVMAPLGYRPGVREVARAASLST
ncbi:MAG: DegT/DnrJ/EryC1/StrS family aminotransferase [Desulfohalobiaceae bacterium]